MHGITGGQYMRIGIFGGTFNPPHLGHLLLAQAALEEAALDRMVFVPCGNPPHKETRGLTDAAHRFEMTRLAICGNPSFEISDIEIRSDAPSYTAKTLEQLKRKYPDDTLCFIVGADSLCEMEGWYHPGEIFSRAEIIAACRGGENRGDIERAAELYREKYNATVRCIAMPEVEISSSDIRQRLTDGRTVRYMLPERVIDYINKTGIYRRKTDND